MAAADSQPRGRLWLNFFTVTAFSLALCLLWNHNIWSTALSLYPEDSFHTLNLLPAFGLAALTLITTVALLAASWFATARLKRKFGKYPVIVIGLDLVSTLLLFWIVLSFTPQIFYSYYTIVMPGLPAQWVVHGLLPFNDYLKVLKILPDATLASHTAGLTGWVLLCSKCIQWIK